MSLSSSESSGSLNGGLPPIYSSLEEILNLEPVIIERDP